MFPSPFGVICSLIIWRNVLNDWETMLVSVSFRSYMFSNELYKDAIMQNNKNSFRLLSELYVL